MKPSNATPTDRPAHTRPHHHLQRLQHLRLVTLVAVAASTQVACGSYDPVSSSGDEAPSRRTTPAVATPANAASPAPTKRSDFGAGARQGLPSRRLAVGGFHACSLDAGVIKCWGYNYFGQLGVGDTATRGDKPGDMGSALQAVDLGGHEAVAIAAGESHTCAILDNGGVTCWGENGSGQLGRGDAVASWGNAPGQMGAGLVTVDLGVGLTAKALSLGTNHSCALLRDDSVKCWGDNSHGQLGQGDTLSRGTTPASLGTGLAPVSLGHARTAKALATGGLHTCAILSDDTLKCWGDNRHGQLGYGDMMDRGVTPLQVGDNLPAIFLGSDITRVLQVATSTYGTCAVLETSGSNILKCWGDNSLGQLGTGDTIDRGNTALSTGNAIPAVSLGMGVAPIKVAAAWDHTCALLDSGATKCWGKNEVGQLGLGDKLDRGSHPNQMGDALPALSFDAGDDLADLYVGVSHSCALMSGGAVKCWGYNSVGQLGQSNLSDIGDDAGEMGNALRAADIGP